MTARAVVQYLAHERVIRAQLRRTFAAANGSAQKYADAYGAGNKRKKFQAETPITVDFYVLGYADSLFDKQAPWIRSES
tara:strand:+ start:205 stop:441 length:237 start_codon:yes stop_codon:yes gene_type:complete